jgi:hypothetical protein
MHGQTRIKISKFKLLSISTPAGDLQSISCFVSVINWNRLVGIPASKLTPEVCEAWNRRWPLYKRDILTTVQHNNIVTCNVQKCQLMPVILCFMVFTIHVAALNVL